MNTSAPSRMAKMSAEVSAVCRRLALISRQGREPRRTPMANMLTAPTEAPSVGVKMPP